MRAAGVPLTVVVGTDNRGSWFDTAAAWLVASTGAQRVDVPGGHAGFDSHPEAFIDLVQNLPR
jgi:pimeloyl-ACP methyl ester carboxylesterase